MFCQLIIISLFGLCGLALIAYLGDDGNPYPPLDEHGRPMKACFSSRGGRFVWVPTSTTSDKEKP